MSFLDSVLSSLQTGKPSQLPLSQPPAAPVSSSKPKKDDSQSVATSRASASANASSGTKRKADEQLLRPPKYDSQTASKLSTTRSAPMPKAPPKPASSLSSTKVVPRSGSQAASKTTSSKPTSLKHATPKPAQEPSKPPPKGSYADLMMQAKAMQDKAPANLGQLRHQAVSKERISRVERKRRLMEAKANEKLARTGKKPISQSPVGKSALQKPEPQMPSYKGTAQSKSLSKSPEAPAYRGTAGLPGIRGTNDRRTHGKRRMNEYLGTDEEDEADYGGYDDYYSDESSDMEAGFDDVEQEEGDALKYARKEDEYELRMEMAAKKEKIERQKRLAALASRNKR